MNFKTLLGTALLSAGSLTLEIALTRVLSVLYVQSYVFLVLSVAVLGVSVGAALATLFPRLRAETALWASAAGLAAVLLTLSSIVTVGSPLWLMFVLTGTPYVGVGLALTSLFSRNAEDSTVLYGADLVGAGLGVVAALPLLNALGGLGGMLAAAALLGLSGVLLGQTRSSLLLTSLTALAVLSSLVFPWLHLDMERLATPKPILEQFSAGGDIVATRWNAFSRTDLVYRADRDAYYLYVDGGAGSLVPDAERPEQWSRDIGSFPFKADVPESAFIIGPGGGLDVALAWLHGVADITAVEVNRSSVQLVRDLGAYAGDVYAPPVKVAIDEGRSVLRRSGRDYDLVFLSQVITQAAEARGYALAENTLYTTNAFHDYLEHLSPTGQIVLKLYDELTLSRALFTALQTLMETGLTEAEATRHVLALLDTRATPPIPLLVVKKQALSREEAVRLARVAEASGYALLFVPGLLENPPLGALAAGREQLGDLIAAAAPTDLRPVSDDRPFFYQFERGLPRTLRPLVLVLELVSILGIVILVSVQRGLEPSLRTFPALFTALGFGFMAVEITLIQRTQLFLGRPALALSLVLGTLLLGGGAGSLLAGRLFKGRSWRGIFVSAVSVAAFLLVWNLAWPTLTNTFLAESLGTRAALTALSLLPLAFALGMPFPLALHWAGAAGEQQVALAWTVNGVASVMGGVAATALGVGVGFQTVGLVALGSYILAALYGALHRAGAGTFKASKGMR